MGVRNLFQRNKHYSRTALIDQDETDIASMTDSQKMTAILHRRDEFPVRMQIAIASTKVKKAKHFMANIQKQLAEQILELDSSVDTLEQVELALRFFPQVLSTRIHGLFPLLWLSRDLKSIQFVPLLAKLGAELGTFHPNERGGMVFGSVNLFEQLASASVSGQTQKQKEDDKSQEQEQQMEQADRKFLQVLQELRSFGLMTSSDVLDYNMIETLCKQTTAFPKQRFLYLIDWNPKALLANNNAVSPRLVGLFCKDLEGTKWLFGLAMKYYPTELGFLFDTTYMVDKDHHASSLQQLPSASNNKKQLKKLCNLRKLSYSPTSLYEFACEAYGRPQVQRMVDGLVHQQMISNNDFTRKAVIRAATHSKESSCAIVYFLMQKDPSLFMLLNSNQHQIPSFLDTQPRAMVLA